MTNQHKPRILLATLILCIWLGSVVILPLIQISPSVAEISRIEAENYDLLNYIEFDDDDLSILTIGVIIAKLGFSKFKPVNLHYQPASLSPFSPPPKHT